LAGGTFAARGTCPERLLGLMAEIRRQTLSLVHRVRAPIVEGAAGSRAPLLLLLHGVGGNELAMAGFAGSFDPRFLVISARAPLTVAPYAFGWVRETFTSDGPVIDPEEAAAAWAGVARFIDGAVRAYDADWARVYVVGFSQGGIIALATMLTAPENVAGTVCMSGRLPPEVLPHVVSPERLRDKAVLIVHGRRDETLDVAYGRGAYETLTSLPLAIEYREFDMGHTTTGESLSSVSAWLTGRLGP
jgi:phospholipase/carboxylesterase